MKVGIGLSEDRDSRKAGARAMEEALAGASLDPRRDPPDLIVLFTTEPYEQEEVLAAVCSLAPGSPLVGGCGGGVIARDAVNRQGVAVGVFRHPGLVVRTALAPDISHDPLGAARRAAEELLRSAGLPLEQGEAQEGPPRGTVLAIPDGFTPDLAEVVRGLYRALGPRYQYAGGGTGDNLRFFRTWQFTESACASRALALALLAGYPLRVALDHGWQPCGGSMIITAAEGKVVSTIDHQPALEAYAQQIGLPPDLREFPRLAMRHPLGIPDAAGNFLIRDPLRADEEGRIHFVTEMPPATVAHVMTAGAGTLAATARETARRACSGFERPAFALVFDCISRFVLLGNDFARELEALREGIGAGVPLLGMLTFGEVGATRRVPMFHNKSLVVVAGGE